jgi:hypothetical protein
VTGPTGPAGTAGSAGATGPTGPTGTAPLYTVGATGAALVSNGTTYVPSTTFGNGTQQFLFKGTDSAGSFPKVYDFQINGGSFFTVGISSITANVSWQFLQAGSAISVADTVVANGGNLKVVAQRGTGTSGQKAGGDLELAGGDAPAGATTLLGGNVNIHGGSGNAGSTDGNVAFCQPGSVPSNWQSMADGMFIGTAGAAPTGNPSGGFFLYVDPADNKLKARGPSGTVTTLALP